MADTSETTTGELRQVPLDALHRRLGARMVPFAGYDMPLQFAGIIAEHNWTRSDASLFDVSHMGQTILKGVDVAEQFEKLVPGNIATLKPGQSRYTLLLNDAGGIIDDLIATRLAGDAWDDRLWLVLNASRAAADRAAIEAGSSGALTPQPVDDRALLALQGPKAAAVLGHHFPTTEAMSFMSAASVTWQGTDILVFRCGYTGEDGFEISLPAHLATAFAEILLDEAEVKPAGLGARDSLRLEAGLPLYGHDIDETTSPVEADLVFAVPKRRREEANFPGAGRILRELDEGPARRRVGIRPAGRAPVREGAAILDRHGTECGVVTSGGFGPTVGGPVAMGYVDASNAQPETPLGLRTRRGQEEAEVATLPFVPHRIKR